MAEEEQQWAHWKVRILIHGAGAIYCSSWTEPQVKHHSGEQLVGLDWTPFSAPGYGDWLGHIDWPVVSAVSWRYSPGREPK